MQIVIDISEELYKVSQMFDDRYEYTAQIPFTVIKNGIPLPKGHGDLIDISDIEWAKHREERNYIDYEVIDWDDIVNASTIIEADRSDAE